MFETSIVKADWDDVVSVWRIATKNKIGEISMVTAKIFVSAAGILAEPNVPSFSGMSTFRGPLFHSARYRHDVDLRGKKVAVIGNGCSACVSSLLLPYLFFMLIVQPLQRTDCSGHWTRSNC